MMSVSLVPSSFHKNLTGKRDKNCLYVFVLHVALKKRVSSKLCIPSCLIKRALFHIFVCVLDL